MSDQSHRSLKIRGVIAKVSYHAPSVRAIQKCFAFEPVTPAISKYLFLFGLNIVLILVGGLVEIYAAIVVVVPLLVPLGLAFGIDPIHLGIIFLANMELGFLAPPVGLNLLLASYRFNKPMVEVMRAVLPMLGVQFVGVLLITYIPAMTTWLPHLLGH